MKIIRLTRRQTLTRPKVRVLRKSKRIQLLTHSKPVKEEHDPFASGCIGSSSVFTFPNLDFGMASMPKAELKRTLILQLNLHSKNEENVTGVDNPNPQELTSDVDTDYQNHRLAAVSWFANFISVPLVYNLNHHSVFLPAVNLMDRYVTTCTDRGEDLSQLLRNIGNIRAACLSLSYKMYAVYTTKIEAAVLSYSNCDDNVLHSSSTKSPGFREFILASLQGLQEAEMSIINTLQGAVFPANAENMINVLCKYLILEHLGHRTTLSEYINGLSRRVNKIAAERLSKMALDIRLLQFRRWKVIAVCCLLGMIEVCAANIREGLHLEDSLISLLEELKPGEFTQQELSDLKSLLTQGCLVCSDSLDSHVHKSLCKVSSMSCSKCMSELN